MDGPDHGRRPIQRARLQETSAWGAAMVAGVGAGVWNSLADAARMMPPKDIFYPQPLARKTTARTTGWKDLTLAARRLGAHTGVSQS